MSADLLLQNASAVGAGTPVSAPARRRHFHAWGQTDSGTGTASINIEGSANGGATWRVIGTLSLTLGTTFSDDAFPSDDRYDKIRANLTAITGTAARVSCAMGS